MAASKTSLSAGHIIRAVLLGDPDVTDITRNIYPVARAEAKLPYIYYRRRAADDSAVKHLPGADMVQMELTCCAKSYDESLELAEIVRASLDGAQATHGDLKMRSCHFIDSEEDWSGDAYIQTLVFNVKIQ